MNITHLDDLTYDYTQIADPNARLLAKLAAQDIKPRLRRAAADIIAIGGKLATVREHLDHGQWLPWLETEFDMAERTARNFVQVARRFDGKSAIIADLGPTALYMLAAPSTPDEAIAEVESLVTNGHTPTVAETKQIIAEAKAPAAVSDPNGGLIANQPQGIGVGKLLVDWTDEDWAGHQAEIDAAVLAVADAPGSVGAKKTKLSDEEEMRIAIDWLSAYRGPHGANWSQMTDNQIHHANSPCFQAWTKAHPEVGDHKLRIKQAMYQLRRRSSILGASTTATQSPIHQITHSDDKNDLSPQETPTRSPAPSSMAVHFTSESEEHYTPDVVWQAAKRVMGTIYLDPCSNSHERPNIPALRHYTIAEDGLRQYWEGSVFLNPPYGRQIGEWVGKLVEAHKTFDVPQAIALLPARVDTQWWQLIRDYPVCFVTGRLKFKGNDDNPAPFPSAIVYLGQRVGDFVREFSPMGDIWRRVQ